MNTDNLIKRFSSAGLVLNISKTPIVAGSNRRNNQTREIFQLDIRRKKANDPGSEYFLMWPGHEDNLAVVQDINKEFSQLILMVKEPRREFEEEVPRATFNHQKARHGKEWLAEFLREHRLQKKDIVVNTPNKLVVRRFTTEDKRHFLLGRDERQLFMERLPRACTTVVQAHGSLRAPQLDMLEGRAPGKTIRQGEWFFVNLTEYEKQELARRIKSNEIAIRRKVALGAGGKPHTADELVTAHLGATGVGQDASGGINDILNGRIISREQSMFVRGAVRHADHKTIKFNHWRRVLRNAVSSQSAAIGGGRWID